MPRFSDTSQERLGSCHPDLQRLFSEVVRGFDCSIICGHRSKADQAAAFEQGLSQVSFPNSKHNITPSRGFIYSRAMCSASLTSSTSAARSTTASAGVVIGTATPKPKTRVFETCRTLS